MADSKLVAVRVNELVYQKAIEEATKLGYIKPSGEPNISEYIRNLIINDGR